MRWTTTILFLFGVQMLFAQYDSIYMAVVPFKTNAAQGRPYVESIRSQVIDQLQSDYRIILLERDEFEVVDQEREYQKTEAFLDGRTVEQGKAIGAEFLLEGFYNYKANLLEFRVYEVASGSLKCSIIADKARTENESGLVKFLDKLNRLDDWGNYSSTSRAKPSAFVISTNIKQLIKECFPSRGWAVLRPTASSKSRVKKLLIAAGSRMKLKKGSIVEILVEESEEVDGQTTRRLVAAGWGRVEKVESENFSILNIEAGSKNIKEQMDAGKKLRCRYVKK